MAIEKLTSLKVARAKPEPTGKARYLGDGAGLYLRIGPAGNRHWIYRYKTDGRTTEMGLGPLHTITLAEAREKARHLRKQRLDGIDPLRARREARQTSRDATTNSKTFRELAELYIRDNEHLWVAKHTGQWRGTLEQYVFPLIGTRPVRSITKDHILAILEQPVPGTGGTLASFWTAHRETASRLRGRIETVLEAAKARGYRSGENPAQWKGHLEHVLAKESRRGQQHLPALPYSQMPAFLRELRALDTLAARALEFCILCATRSGETLGAEWSEFDPVTGLWTIPGSRMKEAAEHRIQLAPAARAIVDQLAALRDPAVRYVFAGDRGRPINADSMRLALRGMGYSADQATVHGFRSAFSDWAHETTNYPAFVIEKALAHKVSSAVEAAYHRSDHLARRARLLVDWAEFLAGRSVPAGEVVAFSA
jgi:integrase